MGIINLIILHKSVKLCASCRKNFQVPKNKKRSIPLLILINLKKDMKAIACTPTAKLAISSQESPHAILLFFSTYILFYFHLFIITFPTYQSRISSLPPPYLVPVLYKDKVGRRYEVDRSKSQESTETSPKPKRSNRPETAFSDTCTTKG